jgi:hypothetical protein
MLDYQRKGYTKYGADMGRMSDLASDTTATLILRHVPLTDGYDPGGAYWGSPDDLYCVTDGEHVAYQRGTPETVRGKYPAATWTTPDVDVSEKDIEEMLDGYIECALWSSNDESDDNGGEPFDANYSADDLADEARAAMRADVEAFARKHAATIVKCFGFKRCDWSLAGHDLWLNRNGHGCGFWDGGWPKEEGKILDDACDELGECYLYLGDDGKIYCE